MSVFSDDERYIRIRKELSRKGGGVNMCEVAERLEKMGIEKGIKQGVEKARMEAICNMIKFGVPEEKEEAK